MSNIWAVGSGRWSNLVTRFRVAVEMSVGEPVGRWMVCACAGVGEKEMWGYVHSREVCEVVSTTG